MANRIRVLPDAVVNQIAAGEVVERPASVVKELVENALDAGADRLVVDAGDGGRRLVRVADDGCGMGRDDALLSLERHATSKIADAGDLAVIRTLGFRGEALPSIAAVSRMTIETCPDEPGEGTRIAIDGGRILSVEPAGRARGTTVTVERLFHNTPARRKFLKAAETEWRHIHATVTAAAFARPETAFVLSHDGREALNLPRATRRGRIEALFGVRLDEDALYIEGDQGGCRLWGYLARPGTDRPSGTQVLLVNGRWVLHRALGLAVQDACGGLFPRGVSPAFGLSLEVDPAQVDVNVHPSKREVRFSDPGAVYRAVAELVGSCLRRETGVPEWGDRLPAAGLHATAPGRDDDRSVATEDPGGFRYPGSPRPMESPVADAGVPFRKERYLSEPLSVDNRQASLPLTITRPEPQRPSTAAEGPPVRVAAWQLHGRYVLAHVREGMIVIDQNLAHRRVVYDRVLRQFREDPASGQALLFPQAVNFGLAQVLLVREAMPLLSKMGFGIRDFGGNSVLIDALPAGVDDRDEGRVFRQIVDALADDSASTLDLNDREVGAVEHALASAFARATAIPAGKPLSVAEMQSLIDQLFGTSEPFVSPEGRPTVVRIGLAELERRFRG